MRFRVLFSDKEYLTSFIDMSSKTDKSLLIDLSFDGELFDDELLITDLSIDSLSHQYPLLNSNAICFLTGRQGEENLSSSPFQVFKFQGFDDLISKIKICSHVYYGTGNIRIVKSHKVGFIFDQGVYYSDFVEQFAKQAVYRSGINVLILPLQFINMTCCGTPSLQDDTSIFKKLIYYINKSEDIPIDSFFYKDYLGCYHFKSSLVLNPIAAMDDTSFDKLIKYIITHYFDLICFDISCCLNKRNIDLLHEMDKVIVLSKSHINDSSSSKLVSELGIDNFTYVNSDVDGSTLEFTINEMLNEFIS